MVVWKFTDTYRMQWSVLEATQLTAYYTNWEKLTLKLECRSTRKILQFQIYKRIIDCTIREETDIGLFVITERIWAQTGSWILYTKCSFWWWSSTPPLKNFKLNLDWPKPQRKALTITRDTKRVKYSIQHYCTTVANRRHFIDRN